MDMRTRASSAGMFVHGPAWHTDQNRRITYQAGTILTSGPGSNWMGDRFRVAQDNIHGMAIMLPDDLVSITHFHPTVAYSWIVSGNLYWDFLIEAGANGEGLNGHTASKGIGATAVTHDIIVELADQSALMAGLGANDYIDITFRRDATNVLDTIGVDVFLIAYLLEYVAEQ